MKTKIEYAHFPTRESRSAYVAQRFASELQGSVLDVGCFEAPLRKLLADVDYTGIDIAGNPDMEWNLERDEPLPFADESFGTVLCIDVLEHLNNLHALFDQLVRVTGRTLIVSLPNCWRDARRPLSRGKGRIGHYGLPPQAPLDRHKWFFSAAEAMNFLLQKAGAAGLEMSELFVTEKPGKPVARLLRRLLYRGDRYINRYTGTVWAIMSKDRGE